MQVASVVADVSYVGMIVALKRYRFITWAIKSLGLAQKATPAPGPGFRQN